MIWDKKIEMVWPSLLSNFSDSLEPKGIDKYCQNISTFEALSIWEYTVKFMKFSVYTNASNKMKLKKYRVRTPEPEETRHFMYTQEP